MAKSTSVDVGERDTIRVGRTSIVTEPFGASIVTGKPEASDTVVDVLVAVGLVEVDAVVASEDAVDVVVVAGVVVEGSAVSGTEPHAVATSATAATVIRNLPGTTLLPSLEEPS